MQSTDPNADIASVTGFLNTKVGEGPSPSDIPSPPAFQPNSSTERRIPAVFLPGPDGNTSIQRTFNAWLEFLSTQLETERYRLERLRISGDPAHLGVVRPLPEPGVHWIAIDPTPVVPYDGTIQDLWSGQQPLAGLELLMLAAISPEIISGKTLFLAGCRFNPVWQPVTTGKGFQTLYLQREAFMNRVVLGAGGAHTASLASMPPLVRSL